MKSAIDASFVGPPIHSDHSPTAMVLANIKLQETTVPAVADHAGWDYDLCESAPGQPIIVIEADNPY